ncbi:hypothetical protein VTN00DRAFT_5770 [Thermoascus crustaceus]|uniref:uncharacterized protein n=1 Tax=Thermoascus crustaceus TaxID=5088 RepID=UPI0037444871
MNITQDGHFDSGYSGYIQQYIAAPAKFVTPIPDKLSYELAAPLLCAGVAMYSAVQKAALKQGDWIVIPAAGGGLGHLFRLGEARSLEATEFLDFKQDDVEARVKHLTNGYGAHAVICTAGVIEAYKQAFQLVCHLGTVV